MFLGVILLLTLSLTLPLGCTEQTGAPTSTEFKTFSKYGMSFGYPRDYDIAEMGLFESEATDASGRVRAFKGDNEVYSVAWIVMVESMWELIDDLQGGVEATFVDMEETEGVARVDKHELVETTKVGHPILYQYYTLTYTDGSHRFGIVANFYCDRSERIFQLVTIHSVIYQKQYILEDFQRYLDSFVCH